MSVFARGNQGLQNPLWILAQKICRNSELNQGHRDFQSLALPTELLRHISIKFSPELVEQALRNLNSVPFHSTGGAIAAYFLLISGALWLYAYQIFNNILTLLQLHSFEELSGLISHVFYCICSKFKVKNFLFSGINKVYEPACGAR